MVGKKKQIEDLKLSNRQTERLIQLYHMEVDLWDVSSRRYYKKESRQRALQNITDTLLLEYPGLQCCVEQVQRKLSYIRGYYSRELGKVNRSKKNGAGPDDVYKSPWMHYKALDPFLRHQISPRTAPLNIRPIFRCKQEVIDIESDREETASRCSDLSAEVCLYPSKKVKLTEPDTGMHQAVSYLEDIEIRPLAKQDINYEDIKNRPLARQDTAYEDIENRSLAKQDINYEDIKNRPLAKEDTAHEDIKDRSLAKQDTAYEDLRNRSLAEQDTMYEDLRNRPFAKQDITYEEIKNRSLAEQDTMYEDLRNRPLAKQDITYEEIKSRSLAEQDTIYEGAKNRPLPKQDTTHENINNRPLIKQQATYDDKNNRSPTKPQTTYEDNDDTIFGKYVTSELRKINDERTKGLLKFKIQSLIFEAQFGNLGTYEKPTNSPV